MLTDIFLQLASRFNPNHSLANNLWLEIFTKYSEPKRYYHNIGHIEQVVEELKQVKDHVKDWETVLFAVFFHDIIYKAKSNTNEEDSALLAKQRLSQLGCPDEIVKKCAEMILATKQHTVSDDADINFLLDADLSVLGKKQDDYFEYTQNIRKEYSIYPDFIYNPGRKKILQKFLQMERIFKTNIFHDKFEKQARINLQTELTSL